MKISSQEKNEMGEPFVTQPKRIKTYKTVKLSDEAAEGKVKQQL